MCELFVDFVAKITRTDPDDQGFFTLGIRTLGVWLQGIEAVGSFGTILLNANVSRLGKLKGILTTHSKEIRKRGTEYRLIQVKRRAKRPEGFGSRYVYSGEDRTDPESGLVLPSLMLGDSTSGRLHLAWQLRRPNEYDSAYFWHNDKCRAVNCRVHSADRGPVELI